MGMPGNPQKGMNIAPDGTVYEILEDGTIKRIGKVSPDGSFEPFGGTKDGIREKNGIIYRVINGKEVKIGRILPNGEIEAVNTKTSRKTKIALLMLLIVLIFLVAMCGRYRDGYRDAQKEQQKVEERKIEKERARKQKIEDEKKADEERNKKEDEAKAKVANPNDQAACEYAREAKDIDAWQLYLKKFPNGICVSDAHEAVIMNEKKKRQEAAQKAKEKEAKLYTDAKKRNIRAAWEYYLSEFPEGKHAFEAELNVNKMRKVGEYEWSNFRVAAKWEQAKQSCDKLEEGGHSDWRLPNIDELRTLIQNCSTETGGECKVSEKNGCLSSKCFGITCSCDEEKNKGYYSKLGDTAVLWSSTSLSNDTDSAWVVYFGRGKVGTRTKFGYNYFRCVRSGAIYKNKK